MYIPKKYDWVGPIATVMIGFAFQEWKGASWDMYTFVRAPLAFASCAWSVYLWKAGVMYQGYMTQGAIDADRRQVEREQAAREKAERDGLEPMPKVKTFRPAMVTNEQIVALPKFDKERNFAVTLLRMREYDGKADLREERWVKTKKFTRAEYVAMLDNWKRYGVIEREGERKNAPYTVVRWDAVRIVASGNPLPRSN